MFMLPFDVNLLTNIFVLLSQIPKWSKPLPIFSFSKVWTLHIRGV